MKAITLTITNPEELRRLHNHILSLPLDKPLEVVIRQKRAHRSLSQNNLYWKWMQEAADFIGVHKDDLDPICKEQCHCPKTTISTPLGNVEERSTSKLNTKEMAEYMDRVFILLSEYGCTLTLPADRQDAA